MKQGLCWSDIKNHSQSLLRILCVQTADQILSSFLSLVRCQKQLSERNKEEGDGFVTDYSRLMSDNSLYSRFAPKLYVICVVRYKIWKTKAKKIFFFPVAVLLSTTKICFLDVVEPLNYIQPAYLKAALSLRRRKPRGN